MPDDDFLSYLDDVSKCFLVRDFSMWAQRIILPFSLVTSSGSIELRSIADLQESFDLYVKANEALHIDDVVRSPVSLEDCRDGTWIGTYRTELLSRGVRATKPYTSSALLKYEGGLFQDVFGVERAQVP